MTNFNSILSKARFWANSPAFDQQTREEVQQLLRDNAESELTERFYRNLSFGTGGMRGIMGAGTFRINRYNIQKATFAVLTYLRSRFPQGTELRVAISYDSRHNSRTFATSAAEVIASFGGKAFVTKDMRPTPLLSYMVRHFRCHAGICITASHNPSSYNGFKVYLSYGGQLVPPHDQTVVQCYNGLEDFTPEISCNYAQALKEGRVEEVGEEVDQRYLDEVRKLSLHPEGRDQIKVVYTPLHGTGVHLVPAALRAFGFQEVHMPPAQAKPDGDFPTVALPNPEDPRAFAQALDLARSVGGDVVLATDPDADRIGVIIKADNDYHFLNGNQLSCLLQDYLLSSLKENGSLPENALIIKTIVTTDLLGKIAERYGAHCEETLTGFKWIAARIEAYERGEIQPYRRFICGGEESYGFLAGDFVRDKDAVLACALTAEMVAYYRSKGFSLLQRLDDIFKNCGVYWEDLHSIDLPGMAGAQQTAALMKGLAERPPRRVAGIEVLRVLDYAAGKNREWQGDALVEAAALEFPSEPVLQFLLRDGSKVSIRPSGTEPKVKIYLAACDQRLGLQGADLAAAKRSLQDKLRALHTAFSELVKVVS